MKDQTLLQRLLGRIDELNNQPFANPLMRNPVPEEILSDIKALTASSRGTQYMIDRSASDVPYQLEQYGRNSWHAILTPGQMAAVQTRADQTINGERDLLLCIANDAKGVLYGMSYEDYLCLIPRIEAVEPNPGDAPLTPVEEAMGYLNLVDGGLRMKSSITVTIGDTVNGHEEIASFLYKVFSQKGYYCQIDEDGSEDESVVHISRYDQGYEPPYELATHEEQERYAIGRIQNAVGILNEIERKGYLIPLWKGLYLYAAKKEVMELNQLSLYKYELGCDTDGQRVLRRTCGAGWDTLKPRKQ